MSIPLEFDQPKVYCAYRYPYDYVPQVEKPIELPIAQINNNTFKVPEATKGKILKLKGPGL